MTLDASASESSANSQHGPAAAARPSIATTMTSNSSPQANQNATPATREKPRQSLTKRYRTEIAASSSSVFSTLVAFPLDSVKTRMQTYQYRGFLDCVKQTYTKESLGGFFRVRDTVGTGIYFMVYESGKQLGTTFAGDSSNKLAVVAAGGSCGLVSWAIIYPIDSAKSIYQRNSLLYARGEKVEPPPKITFFKRDMYRGLAVSMSRSCVVNAIFFSSFEFIKKHIKDNG
ncbi:mitochondrial carrier protein [Beauveria brongniartii RCEF 3172]|uniref:Mitochondrial carrier protein n=1 Tax=Beauveria brongniartii RCEF 3172 TaxID=1081107 RepID=A0A167K4J4_9HYPO|nr:mitochondrial carrier protein [Beauveria brongniartii RCEF 3172]